MSFIQPARGRLNYQRTNRNVSGRPLERYTTVTLNGTQSGVTITDNQGNYRFDNLETAIEVQLCSSP